MRSGGGEENRGEGDRGEEDGGKEGEPVGLNLFPEFQSEEYNGGKTYTGL